MVMQTHYSTQLFNKKNKLMPLQFFQHYLAAGRLNSFFNEWKSFISPEWNTTVFSSVSVVAQLKKYLIYQLKYQFRTQKVSPICFNTPKYIWGGRVSVDLLLVLIYLSISTGVSMTEPCFEILWRRESQKELLCSLALQDQNTQILSQRAISESTVTACNLQMSHLITQLRQLSSDTEWVQFESFKEHSL